MLRASGFTGGESRAGRSSRAGTGDGLALEEDCHQGQPAGCKRNAPVRITPDDRKRPRQGTNRASAARTVPQGNSETFAVSTPWPDQEVAGQGRLSASRSPHPRGEQPVWKPALTGAPGHTGPAGLGSRAASTIAPVRGPGRPPARGMPEAVPGRLAHSGRLRRLMALTCGNLSWRGPDRRHQKYIRLAKPPRRRVGHADDPGSG